MWDEDGNMAAALLQMSCRYRGMLAVRATGVRTLIPGLVPVQFRAFSVRKDPELEENPFYQKYQDKIRHLRSSKPQEFKARLENRHQIKQEVLGRSQQAEFVKLMEQELEQRDKKSGDGQSAVFRKNKTLDSILNLDMIQNKTADEISQLWMQYFSTQDTISAIIPTQTYEMIHSRAEACPMFLFALPQMDGYEFFVGQWSGHQLHFTSLINIQSLGENAPSQLILHHYPELKDRGLVLMTAERDNNFVTLHQAQCLANQVQLFYGSQRQETFRLVETFNHAPTDFKHMAVIAELEQSGLGPGLKQNQDKPGPDQNQD